MSKARELAGRFREACTDWDGTPEKDLAEPVHAVTCGQLRGAADLIESQAKAIEEMLKALKQCHAALTTLTRPDAIASTTVGAAWAECVAAETAARKILDHSKEGEQG